jgi:hypothetical protein
VTDFQQLRELTQAPGDDDRQAALFLLIGLFLILGEKSAYPLSKLVPPDPVLAFIEHALMHYPELKGGEVRHPSVGELRIALRDKFFVLEPNPIAGLADKEVPPQYKYDVCVSFAGTNRAVVEKFCLALKSKGASVFYDEFQRDSLWGADLAQQLFNIYYADSRYCVVFFSKEYRSRRWTQHELRSAMLRGVDQGPGYLLPVVVDSDSYPSELKGVSYWPLNPEKIEELADTVWNRVWETKYADWLDVDQVAEVLNRDRQIEAVLSDFREEVSAATDPLRRLALSALGLMVSTQLAVADTTNKLFQYLSFHHPALQPLFQGDDFGFGSDDACIRRFAGKDGPFLLKAEYVDSLVERFGFSSAEEASDGPESPG